MGVFDENLEANLQQLAQELKSGTFEPFPVRRVYIPKAGGRVRPYTIVDSIYVFQVLLVATGQYGHG
jgi:retron-type reverse transcriptase